MNAAMVVKCGRVSAASAMNTTFSPHARAIARLEMMPGEYANSTTFKRIAGSMAGAPVSSFI
jgi:hypothetical protein